MNNDSSVPVSVVIPCYRCADTVLRAVHSVWTQTAPPVELILVDDASGDATPAKLRELQETYGERWVKVISRGVNAGPAQARNAGWDAATQPYVAFLDADNTWHPRKLEIQCRWMWENPDVAFSGHGCVLVRGGAVSRDLPASWSARSIRTWQQLLWNRFQTSSVMIRGARARFPAKKRHSEDYLLWTQLLLAGKRGSSIDLPLGYHYKPLYGHSGPSGDLWAMEMGELASYRTLADEGHLARPTQGLLVLWSLAKYMRRQIICRLR